MMVLSLTPILVTVIPIRQCPIDTSKAYFSKIEIMGKIHGDRVFAIESFPNCKVVKTLTFCHVAKQRSLPAAIFSSIDVPAHITCAASE